MKTQFRKFVTFKTKSNDEIKESTFQVSHDIIGFAIVRILTVPFSKIVSNRVLDFQVSHV